MELMPKQRSLVSYSKNNLLTYYKYKKGKNINHPNHLFNVAHERSKRGLY